MNELDRTFELLSSMSPKLKRNRTKKHRKKSPHKLSLKTNIRRSLLFDKAPHSHHVRDTSVIILDESIVINTSLSPNNVKILKKPIIISSTSESEESEEQQIPVASKVKSKSADIDKWLSDNEKLDVCLEPSSHRHNSFSESDDDKLNSSYKSVKTVKSPSGDWSVVSIESKLGKELLHNPEKKLDKLGSQKMKLESSFSKDVENNDGEDLAAKILDDLYGVSWRNKKDEILCSTEPRKTKKELSIKLSKTERKPPKTAIWSHRLNDLCDSDSSNGSVSSISCKSVDNLSDPCKKLSFSDSDSDIEEINKKYDMSPLETKKKPTINKKLDRTRGRSSISSNEINFSESDHDSLGTRVRKKLAKKAKDLSTTKTKKNANEEPKTKLKNKIVPKAKTENKRDKSDNSKNKTEVESNSKNFEQKCSFLKSLSGGVAPWQCNPEALLFKTNFKDKRQALAQKLFNLYNENIFNNAIPTDTPIQWNDRMRGTAGFCYNRRVTKPDGTVIRSCRIALAVKILDTADRLRDTLVHEMCHAATWLVNNVADGHGPYWKAWASKAMTIYPELPSIKRCHDYQISTKYTYKCVDCGYSIGRHSKSLDIERKRCGYCHGKFEIFINKVNKHGIKEVAPATPKAKPTGFALYVKENYGLVKRANLKHGEVMKILGQQFSALKINLCK